MSKTDTLIKIGDLLDICKQCSKNTSGIVPTGGWEKICSGCQTFDDIQDCRKSLGERAAHQKILDKGEGMTTNEIMMLLEDDVPLMQIREALKMPKKGFDEMIKNLKRGGSMELTKELYKQYKSEGMTDKLVMKKHGMHSAGLDRWKRKNLTDEERGTYQLKKGAPTKVTEKIVPVQDNIKVTEEDVANSGPTKSDYAAMMADLEKHIKENEVLRKRVEELTAKLEHEISVNKGLQEENVSLALQIQQKKDNVDSSTELWRGKYTTAEKERLAALYDCAKAEEEIEDLKHELTDLQDRYNQVVLQNEEQWKLSEPMRKLLKVLL